MKKKRVRTRLLILHLVVRYTPWSKKYGNWKQLKIKIALNVPAESEIQKLCLI